MLNVSLFGPSNKVRLTQVLVPLKGILGQMVWPHIHHFGMTEIKWFLWFTISSNSDSCLFFFQQVCNSCIWGFCETQNGKKHSDKISEFWSLVKNS